LGAFTTWVGLTPPSRAFFLPPYFSPTLLRIWTYSAVHPLNTVGAVLPFARVFPRICLHSFSFPLTNTSLSGWRTPPIPLRTCERAGIHDAFVWDGPPPPRLFFFLSPRWRHFCNCSSHFGVLSFFLWQSPVSSTLGVGAKLPLRARSRVDLEVL